MPAPARFLLSVSVLVTVAVAIGLIMFDWVVAVGLAVLSVGGESLRLWILRRRVPRR